MATTVSRTTPGRRHSRSALRRWPGAALAAALAAAVYVNALDNPFVYDDRDTVVANPSLADPSNVRFVLTHSPFRPVVNASYALDRAVWGPGPFGFHATNVALHAGVVWLLYALVLRACADARARATGAPPAFEVADGRVAFAASALFGAHPIMSEAVAYVSGRSELLCGFFFLATVVCARGAIVGSGRRGLWAVAGICGVLALLSKEVAGVLPIVLLAYDWLLAPGPEADRRRRMWLLFVPGAAVLVAAAIYRLSVAAGPVSGQAPLLTLWTQSIVIWRYLGLLVLPAGQSIMHGVHTVTSAADPKAIAAVTGLIGLAGAAIWWRRALPLASFGILWYLAVLAPSSSVIALREGMAEHRAYLASAGMFMALAGALSWDRRLARVPRPPAAYVAVFGVLCVALGALTYARNAVWGDPVRLWREAVARAPGMWEPHYALADTMRERGDCPAALEHYRSVVRLRPHHRDAHTNMGICLAEVGRLEEADASFRRAIEIDPGFARGYTNLGALALLARQPDRARDMYREALDLEPGSVLARMQLARLYEAVYGDFHAAARMCGEARALAPATPGVRECVERNQRLAADKDAGR